MRPPPRACYRLADGVAQSSSVMVEDLPRAPPGLTQPARGVVPRDQQGRALTSESAPIRFLGYSFWYAKGGTVKRRVASKTLVAMKDRVRDITKRSGGRSLTIGDRRATRLSRRLEELLPAGGHAKCLQRPRRMDSSSPARDSPQTPEAGNDDLSRARQRGMRPDGSYGARRIAGNGRRWWRNSGKAINIAFPISYFDGLGLPRLAATSTR